MRNIAGISYKTLTTLQFLQDFRGEEIDQRMGINVDEKTCKKRRSYVMLEAPVIGLWKNACVGSGGYVVQKASSTINQVSTSTPFLHGRAFSL